MRVFYTLPTSIEAHPYLRWDLDPTAQRYIHKLIDELETPPALEPIARILIARLEDRKSVV